MAINQSIVDKITSKTKNEGNDPGYSMFLRKSLLKTLDNMSEGRQGKRLLDDEVKNVPNTEGL